MFITLEKKGLKIWYDVSKTSSDPLKGQKGLKYPRYLTCDHCV